jgi:hypothetical protein
MYSEPGVGKGSLTYADGMLYTFAESGRKVGLVKPTPAGHQVVSEFEIPKAARGNLGRTLSSVMVDCTCVTAICCSSTMSKTS